MKWLATILLVMTCDVATAAPAQLYACEGVDTETHEAVTFDINYADSSGPGKGYSTEELVFPDGRTFPLNQAANCTHPDPAQRFPEVSMYGSYNAQAGAYDYVISASCEAEIWFNYQVTCKKVY